MISGSWTPEGIEFQFGEGDADSDAIPVDGTVVDADDLVALSERRKEEAEK